MNVKWHKADHGQTDCEKEEGQPWLTMRGQRTCLTMINHGREKQISIHHETTPCQLK